MNQTADLEWRDDMIPVSTQFDDPYFSIHNGLAETRHVFLGGNDIPARFRDGFHVAELGFGTGLNMLATLLEWRASGATGRFHFTSFEAFPMAADDIDRALQAFPEAHAIAGPFLDQWRSGARVIETHDMRTEIIIGDARTNVAQWENKADAWFLDGFSPAKNPELWEADLMNAVGAHTATGGTCATYTAAGFVRRNLADAGFDIDRVQGFGRKRHMTVGRFIGS